MSDIVNKSINLTSDVYKINQYVNEIKKDFIPNVSEDTLMLGIFGYTGQVFSDLIQNTIVMASEFSNESIPTKAKFEKNIIAHALGFGITDINAIPATFDVLLTFIEDDIESWYDSKRFSNGEEFPWEFTLDKDIPIFVGDFEFHVDYDILFKKVRINTGIEKNRFAYTAKYLIDVDNPVSDITNPYLASPVRMNVNGKHVIFTKCTLRQVEKQTIFKKVLSDNSITSKTVTFEYEGQLADFTIDVTEGDTTTHLIPVYEGLSVENKKYPHFYYSYLDSNTIRIKFDRSSYAPRINSDIKINLQTTQGESGNFEYAPKTYPGFSAESEKYGYSNIACEIRPITGESSNGTDRKSVEELKKLIPKEALSRGSITNLTDVENFFNMLNSDNSILYFYKKRDNALERLYYSYIIMKDMYNVIIPTNTIDIEVEKENIEAYGKQVIRKNQCFKLENGKGIAYDINNINPDYGNNFYYIIPYNFVINSSPLYVMCFLTTIDINKFLDFSFINEECIYQYIATSIQWQRGYNENPNTYELNVNMIQNIEDKDANTVNTSSKDIRCVAVFYDKDDNPLRWSEAELVSRDLGSNTFSFKFKFETDDYIDMNNRIRINTGLYDISIDSNKFLKGECLNDVSYIEQDSEYSYPSNMPKGNIGDYIILDDILYEYGTNNIWDIPALDYPVYIMISSNEENKLYLYENSELKEALADNGNYILINNKVFVFNNNKWEHAYSYAHFSANTKCVIHVISKQDGEPHGLNKLDEIIPLDKEEFSLSNSYTVVDGVDFFYDFSNIVNSIITVDKDENDKEFFTIKNVPVVKYDYFDEDKAIDFCKELVKRKNYIDYAIKVLEDTFEMDFKFFNTYGPSKLFTTDNESNYLNRTNLSLTFRIKLRANYDTNIINDIKADIKDYIEDINEINTIHMPNLVSNIITKYIESVEFFEFVDMNGYGPSVQHIYSMEMPDRVIVPEFVNVMALDDGTPDINLILV